MLLLQFLSMSRVTCPCHVSRSEFRDLQSPRWSTRQLTPACWNSHKNRIIYLSIYISIYPIKHSSFISSFQCRMHNDLPIIDFIGGAQRKIISKCVVWVYAHMLVLNIRLLMARVWLRRVIKLIITTCSLELQTEIHKDFTITEKASSRAFFLVESAH